MSHPSKTTTNKANSSESMVSSIKHEATTSPSVKTIKRTVSDEIESQPKKIMVHHHSLDQHNQYSATVSLQPKFISAAQVAATTNTNINTIPEISDEELLAMALMFEKTHQQ